MNIKENILQYFIERDKNQAIDFDNILTFNYMDNHFFTSIEFIQMIADLEDTFGIAFDDAHLKNQQFAVVGGLIKMVEQLCRHNFHPHVIF